MNVIEVLTAARKLIEQPENWSPKGWGNGERRCAVAAIAEVEEEPSKTVFALERACGIYPGEFNDVHSHAEVLAAFDRAIAAERARATP